MIDIMSDPHLRSLAEIAFSRLKPNCLFNHLQKDYFIAVSKESRDSWKVIPLNEENRENIIKNKPCTTTTFKLEDARGINIG